MKNEKKVIRIQPFCMKLKGNFTSSGNEQNKRKHGVMMNEMMTTSSVFYNKTKLLNKNHFKKCKVCPKRVAQWSKCS